MGTVAYENDASNRTKCKMFPIGCVAVRMECGYDLLMSDLSADFDLATLWSVTQAFHPVFEPVHRLENLCHFHHPSVASSS